MDIYASLRVALPTLIGKVVVADLPTSIIALTADMILITDKKLIHYATNYIYCLHYSNNNIDNI